MVVLAAFYFPLAVSMYYFNRQVFHLGVDIYYKMAFALGIIAFGFLIFLVKTDLTRAKLLIQYVFLLSLPHITAILVSLPVWVFRMAPMNVIRRGLFSQVYHIIIILAGASNLYMFGKSGLWLNLAAMLSANLITIVSSIHKAGFGKYWEEFKTLIFTFGAEKGSTIAPAEIHELTFALGLYLLYLILDWKNAGKHKFFWPMLLLTAFCYLSGFKRIGVFAIALCVAAKWVLTALTRGRNRRWGWLLIFSLMVISAMFFYIFLVRAGLFEFLEKNWNVDTKGRLDLYLFIEEHYHIGPGYSGQGAGFIARLFEDQTGLLRRIGALHNDILVIYIDLGFWGFWLWMIAYLPVRSITAAKWQGIHGGILTACYGLFVLSTALTDNTIYYIYMVGTAAILTMGRYSETQAGILEEAS